MGRLASRAGVIGSRPPPRVGRAAMADPEQSPSGGVTPHLTIGHGKGEAAVAFYAKAFAAAEQMRHMGEDGRRIMHCHLTINGGLLMLNDDSPEKRGGREAD